MICWQRTHCVLVTIYHGTVPWMVMTRVYNTCWWLKTPSYSLSIHPLDLYSLFKWVLFYTWLKNPKKFTWIFFFRMCSSFVNYYFNKEFPIQFTKWNSSFAIWNSSIPSEFQFSGSTFLNFLFFLSHFLVGQYEIHVKTFQNTSHSVYNWLSSEWHMSYMRGKKHLLHTTGAVKCICGCFYWSYCQFYTPFVVNPQGHCLIIPLVSFSIEHHTTHTLNHLLSVSLPRLILHKWRFLWGENPARLSGRHGSDQLGVLFTLRKGHTIRIDLMWVFFSPDFFGIFC